nr:carbon monoxide dehydrogenase subunit G [Rhizobium sp. CFBP 8762]
MIDLKGEERIAAPRDSVWAALNDPAVLQHCIPGCESLEWTSPSDLAALVKLRVGPLPIRFRGEIHLTNVNPPVSYTISGNGTGGLAGVAGGSADVTLTEDGNETILHYDITATLGGRLAQLGAKLMGSTAHRIAAKFFADFSAAAAAKTASG